MIRDEDAALMGEISTMQADWLVVNKKLLKLNKKIMKIQEQQAQLLAKSEVIAQQFFIKSKKLVTSLEWRVSP